MSVMGERSPELQAFLQTLAAGIAEGAAAESATRAVVDRIMKALRMPSAASTKAPAWLPPCDLIAPLVDSLTARDHAADASVDGPDGVVAHAHALAALAPQLAWWRRPNEKDPSGRFVDGHANATVIGQGGLEERDDVWVGISVLVPDICYPEHRHPPEEVYLVLSPGHWQQDGGDWHEPGIGGVVHNVPDIPHAMRSGASPLLTTWCLWRGDSA